MTIAAPIFPAKHAPGTHIPGRGTHIPGDGTHIPGSYQDIYQINIRLSGFSPDGAEPASGGEGVEGEKKGSSPFPCAKNHRSGAVAIRVPPRHFFFSHHPPRWLKASVYRVKHVISPVLCRLVVRTDQ
ncbi:hypothetical protein JKG47_18975 [Acidithiobacillus sp. MC6.1]|nr:hypothetical protein [Acidithiobacillus sp. MC6.1]